MHVACIGKTELYCAVSTFLFRKQGYPVESLGTIKGLLCEGEFGGACSMNGKLSNA